jgi:hypothetical protein
MEVGMPDSIAERISSLPGLSRDALSQLWKELFDAPHSPRLRRDLTISILTYRLQERAFRPLNARDQSRLLKLAHAFETSANAKTGSAPRLRPGTRLVRQWGNQVHLVNVESNGYEYKGAQYHSLSQIARLITGTRWSGPLFFGIKNEQTGGNLKEAQ